MPSCTAPLSGLLTGLAGSRAYSNHRMDRRSRPADDFKGSLSTTVNRAPAAHTRSDEYWNVIEVKHLNLCVY
jgi:hypothetical protein